MNIDNRQTENATQAAENAKQTIKNPYRMTDEELTSNQQNGGKKKQRKASFQSMHG